MELKIILSIPGEAHNELRIDVLRSQNIIPVELSPVFPLDFKVSLLGVNIYRWNRLILR